jgi:regulator of extracellular matrix RemA (YlzA/DUF370 family)
VLILIGNQHFIKSNFIVEILKPEGARAIRIRRNAAGSEMLINATEGKRIRSMITLNTGHVVLSAVAPKTLESRRTKNADSSFGDRRVAAYPALNQDINYSKWKIKNWINSFQKKNRMHRNRTNAVRQCKIISTIVCLASCPAAGRGRYGRSKRNVSIIKSKPLGINVCTTSKP